MRRTVCWEPTWTTGFEHLLLQEGRADGVVLAVDDEHGPFRLSYALAWDADWRLREASLDVVAPEIDRSLLLRANGQGLWTDGGGRPLSALDGCIDIDIWPTPFTNSFPLRRTPLAVGERREFRMAWVRAPELTVVAQPQAYTRLGEHLYRFEDLAGFAVDLRVDEDALVVDYPGLFLRSET